MKPVITLPVRVVIDFVEMNVFDQMPIPVFHRDRMCFRRRITRIAAVCSVSFHDSAVQVDGVHIRVKRKIVDHQRKMVGNVGILHPSVQMSDSLLGTGIGKDYFSVFPLP